MLSLEKLKLETFPQPDPKILKYPVLLCHGLGAVGSVIRKSLLQDECVLYRLHCVMAIAPNIVPYARIEVRAKAWAEILEQVLKETRAEKIHIIAHSMAGLDIRYLICNEKPGKSIASLTTVASPHRGSCLTGLTLGAPGSIKKSLIEISNWFGNNVYPNIPSDMLGALEELSPDFVNNEFNPACPDVDWVKYLSVTAACGKGTDTPINNLLIPFNNYIYKREGPNDGYVSQKSAEWGRVIATTGLSHIEQMNINLPARRKSEWQNLWLNIIDELQAFEISEEV